MAVNALPQIPRNQWPNNWPIQSCHDIQSHCKSSIQCYMLINWQ